MQHCRYPAKKKGKHSPCSGFSNAFCLWLQTKKKKVILYTNSLIFTDVYSFFIKAWLSRGWEAWAYINPWVRWGMGIWRCCYCPNYRLVVICYGCCGKVLAGTTCSYPGIGKRGVLGLKYPESSVANPGCPTMYYNRAMALCSGP